MNTEFKFIVSEIVKYVEGVHILNDGANEDDIICFEKKFKINIPNSYKKWLRLYNGGEFFALPVGTSFAGIQGDSERRKGVFYLEDNFNIEKRTGILNNLFIIGELCDSELIGFDLQNTTIEDGRIIQYDVESGEIVDEWNGFVEWLKYVFEEGKEMFNYEGNER